MWYIKKRKGIMIVVLMCNKERKKIGNKSYKDGEEQDIWGDNIIQDINPKLQEI